MSSFTDRVLTCMVCRSSFTFTAGEQQFFSEKNFKNDPKRCKACSSARGSKTASDGGATTGRSLPKETVVRCAACNILTTVPFKPTQNRPIFCRSCLKTSAIPAAAAQVAECKVG